MKDIDDITKALAAKYGGMSIKEDKPEPKPEPRREPRHWSTGDDTRARDDFFSRRERAERERSSEPSTSSGPRIMPSERMLLRNWKGNAYSIPQRPQVLMNRFTDQELDEMFATPAKRGWDFHVWLEVIGLPPDLHEKHDAPMYQYAARAFLKRKEEAHRG